jgi:hypothetical protein
VNLMPFPTSLLMAGGLVSLPLAPYGTDEAVDEQEVTGNGNDVIIGAGIENRLPEPNTDYIFFWSQDLYTGSAAIQGATDIHSGAGSIFTTKPRWNPDTPEEYYSMGGMFRLSAGDDPDPVSYSLRLDTNNNGTVRMRNSRLSWLKLGPDDEYTQSIARQTTTSASAQTMATLSFTASGAYLIIASFNIDLVGSTNVRYSVELTDEAGNTTTEVEYRPINNNNREPTMLILPCASLAGAKNFKLKIRESGTGSTTIGISEIRMLALKQDRFASVDAILLTSDSTNVSTTFNNALSQSVSPSGDHLLLACWAIGMDSTTIPGGARLLDGADTVNESLREGNTSLVSDGLPGSGHRLKDYAGGSIVQAIQKRSVGSADDVRVQAGCAALALIQLEGIT